MKSTYKKIASYEANGKIDKVLLLYSGGLDTSVMIKWLMDNYGAEVTTLTVNIGQTDGNFEEVKQKALDLGVKKALVVDAQEDFAKEYLVKAVMANADYQGGGYHLFCPLGRIIIAEKAVEIAQQEKIKIIAHGATGKGNDQVRFDSYITTLNPEMKILAPVREWHLTRQEEIAYAKKHNIPISNHSKHYSYDENLWGNSAEGGEIEDIMQEPKLDKILIQNQLPTNAHDKPANLTIEFVEGVPVAINDHKIDFVNLIKALTALGSAHGIGTTYLTEDRIVGLKVRGICEQPAARILITAHKELEKLVSTYEENEFKSYVNNQWSAMCYRAHWYNPLMENLNKFILNHNKKVSGKVNCVLYKGNIHITSIDSPFSLIDCNLASFDTQGFNQGASAGFIEHYSLQTKMAKLVG